MKLEEFLIREYGYNPEMKKTMQDYVEVWKSWYNGHDKNFHDYFIYNGQTKVPQKRYTMNMAKEISEDWADIIWSEKCEVSFKDDNSKAQYEELIDELDLNSIISSTIERSGAMGTSATVTSVYDLITNEDGMYLDVSQAKQRVDIVDFEWIFPLSWNNKTVTECAFGSVEYHNGQKYIVLSVHKLQNNGNYVIHNHLFKETKGTLSIVEQNKNVMKDFDTKSPVKWFSIFKPPLTNNFVNNSPFGISYYANAIDNLKSVDLAFDMLNNELRSGKRRTFVRSDMLSYEDGTQKMVFDKNDIDIYVLPKGATKDDLIQHDNEDLRTDKQMGVLNLALNLLGNKVGFGENHYHFDGAALNTATAVVSSNSKLFRRKKKLEIGYESSIFDLIMSVCYAASTFGTRNINTEDMVIQFDDSIIEDKESESNRAMREVSAGVLSKQEYREKIFGETPEIAEQEIQKINAANPSIEEMFGSEE